MIFFISSTENKRLLELEIELENFKDQTEELKTKLLCFEENKRLQNKRLLELEIELENFKDQTEELKTKLLINCEIISDQTEELKTKLLCFEENKRLRKWKKSEAVEQLTPKTFHNQILSKSTLQVRLNRTATFDRRLSGLQSSRDDFQEPFDDSSGRQSRRMECERTSRCQKSRTSTRLRNELSQTREYHFRYEGDFDTKGVIHYLGFNAGVSIWLNPARVPSSGVKVTYCDGNGRGDPENILEYFTPGNSSTRSGWCLDLGDYYTLRPTDYTVRQLGSNDRNFLQNFELLGRLCNDDDWCVLGRHHQVDWRSQRFSHMLSGNKDLSYKTKTWSVKGEVRAYSQFKIVQIKDMSTSVPGTHAMSLAGIELYGVLSVPFFE
ncbi:unnamed protein product [Porites lobata]|uniref:Uncharacterized protein n=1 Tax=Porites lobata TaxID=104759 RepID=A0ABN8RJA4_9CNID|nr:unnamed protein product [Porites lobata]